jgi:hypothetical protein
VLIFLKSRERFLALCEGCKLQGVTCIEPAEVEDCKPAGKLLFCDYTLFGSLSRRSCLRKHPLFPIDCRQVPDLLKDTTYPQYIDSLKDFCYGVYRNNESLAVRFGDARAGLAQVERNVLEVGRGLLGFALSKDKHGFLGLRLARVRAGAGEWFELLGKE